MENELVKLRIASEIRFTEEEVRAWLRRFCTGDLFDPEFRRNIIDTFINCIYLYDDRIIIFYNIKGGKQVSFVDLAESLDNESESSGFGFETQMLHQNKSESVRRFGFFAFSTDAHIKKAGGVGDHASRTGNGRCRRGLWPLLRPWIVAPSLCRRRRLRACGRDQRAFRSPFGSLRSSYLVRAFVSQDAGRLFFGVSA